MNKMDTAMLRHELQGLIDNHTPQYEVQRIARRAIQFMDQAAHAKSERMMAELIAELQIELLEAKRTAKTWHQRCIEAEARIAALELKA